MAWTPSPAISRDNILNSQMGIGLMKQLITRSIPAVTIVLTLCGTTMADMTYNVSPDNLVDPVTFATGGGMVAWDWDQAPPFAAVSPGAGAPGFGTTSFYSNVQGSAAGGPRDYTAVRFSPKNIYGVADVTIGEIQSLSYWSALVSGLDWQIKIYTEPGAPGSTWYGKRFNFEVPNNPGAGWMNYGTAGAGALDVEWIRSGDGSLSVFPNMPLADVVAAYASEKILFIDIIAGYLTSSPPSHTFLDGVQLTVGGETASINFVPLPGAVLLGALGLGLIGGAKRRSE
jgi:hypothetical protein